MNRTRNSRPPRGTDGADVRVRTTDIVDVLAECRSKADTLFAADFGGSRECLGGFAGHAELAARELGGDVLARLAGQRQFEVVDRRGAVHGDALDQAAVD